jgi:hypothetical protein
MAPAMAAAVEALGGGSSGSGDRSLLSERVTRRRGEGDTSPRGENGDSAIMGLMLGLRPAACCLGGVALTALPPAAPTELPRVVRLVLGGLVTTAASGTAPAAAAAGAAGAGLSMLFRRLLRRGLGPAFGVGAASSAPPTAGNMCKEGPAGKVWKLWRDVGVHEPVQH